MLAFVPLVSALTLGGPRSGRAPSVAMSASRREFGISVVSAAALSCLPTSPATAAAPKTVLVAGATGQTGRRILERLANKDGLLVTGGVRSPAAAEKTLAEASITVRGAMVQQVNAVDTKAVSLAQLDVVKDSVSSMTSTLQGVEALVIATGFVPGNPFKMGAAAHAVDNLGTVALVDAAKAAGVSKVVLVSSILTNGRNWGQEKSPGFVVTNAFGGVLDEKLEAEKYLRSSGLDYTIVRPGGLKSTPPSGALVVSAEDTLNSGEISRDLVADVCVAALFDEVASNKVVEIFESEDPKATAPPAGKWFYGLNM